MNDHHHSQEHELAELRALLSSASAEMHALTDVLAQSFANGEIAAFTFNGKAGITEITDDQGSNALAYAVYNDTDVELRVDLNVGAGLTIPKRKLIVAPITINGSIGLKADATALKETTITVLRWRFPTPQPFFVGSLE